jgi:hypothetical protein
MSLPKLYTPISEQLLVPNSFLYVLDGATLDRLLPGVLSPFYWFAINAARFSFNFLLKLFSVFDGEFSSYF